MKQPFENIEIVGIIWLSQCLFSNEIAYLSFLSMGSPLRSIYPFS